MLSRSIKWCQSFRLFYKAAKGTNTDSGEMLASELNYSALTKKNKRANPHATIANTNAIDAND